MALDELDFKGQILKNSQQSSKRKKTGDIDNFGRLITKKNNTTPELTEEQIK